jgi:hypothetical protein
MGGSCRLLTPDHPMAPITNVVSTVPLAVSDDVHEHIPWCAHTLWSLVPIPLLQYSMRLYRSLNRTSSAQNCVTFLNNSLCAAPEGK